MDPIVQIIIAVIGSGAFFTFIQFLINRHDDKADKIKELQEEIKIGLDERENKGRERFEIHEEAVAKLNEAIIQLTENDTKQTEYMKYIGDELMGLAHDKLVYLTDHYQKRGAITLKEKATLEAIYRPYHEGLGGNGDGKTGFEYAMQLPVVTDAQAFELDRELKIDKYYRRDNNE